jgi:hypothetical protein
MSTDYSRRVRESFSQTGASLFELSCGCKVLATFLRHSGCTFCHQTLSDLAKSRASIEASVGGERVRLVLVHMMPEKIAGPFFANFGLGDLPRISDPGRHLYAALELKRGKILQLFGSKVWWRGFMAGFKEGHGWGRAQAGEDWKQMPGIFLIKDGEVVFSFRHESASDRPDYVALASCFDESALPALTKTVPDGVS